MAEKKGSRFVWIFVALIVMGLLEEFPRVGEGAIIVVFWLIIIGFTFKKAFRKEGTDGINQFVSATIKKLEKESKTVYTHEDGVIKRDDVTDMPSSIQEASDAYRPTHADMDIGSPSFDHQQTIDGKKSKVKTPYTTKKLIKKYYIPETIKEDDLTKEEYDPFTLTGK